MARRSKPETVKFTAEMRVVVLHGPEQMLKQLRLKQLCEALEPVHGSLEPIVLDGRSATLAEVFDEVRGYSLLESYKVVVVDHAEDFVKTHRQVMERYAAKPVDHATLVLRADTWHKGNLDKLIAKVGAIVRCDDPSESEAQRWAIGRCQKEHARKLAPDAAAALVERVGAHLLKLDTELAKLALMVAVDQPVTRETVERHVQRGSEQQAWGVQDALLSAMQRGDASLALEAVHELVELSGQAEVLVGYFVADLIRKLTVAQAMAAGGEPTDQIAKVVKVWGTRQRLFFAVLRKIDAPTARKLLAAVLEADMRAKTGLGESKRNIERFCVQLVDTIK